MTLTETETPLRSHGARPRRIRLALGAGACAAAMLVGGGQASAASGGIGPNGGEPTVKGKRAKIGPDGKAIAPAAAPRRVKRAIRAANRIEDKPYRYGGGHARWRDRGYDCSGAASFVLGKHGAGVLKSPMPSGSFMNWGKRGRGKWITVFANRGHMYLVIAGLRFDTSMTPGSGPGWSKSKLFQSGFKVRHPRGL